MPEAAMFPDDRRASQLVEAELLRMFPERAKLRPKTPDEFREAWSSNRASRRRERSSAS